MYRQRPEISDIWQYNGQAKYLIVMVQETGLGHHPYRVDLICVEDPSSFDGQDYKGQLTKDYEWPAYPNAWAKVE